MPTAASSSARFYQRRPGLGGELGKPYTRAVGYALKLAGAAIVILALGILGIVVFTGIWTRVGFVAAMVVVFGGLLAFAWQKDRKAKESRAGLERI